jgi:small subunit ribosomal protein S21
MSRNKETRGCKVILSDTMPINVALRKFKQKVDDSNVLETVRANMYFEKPTTSRKRKAGAARSRWLKKLREQELPKKMY